MEPLSVMNVEMALTLPAVLLCQWCSSGKDREEPLMKVEQAQGALRLTPSGGWTAEMLLEGLPKTLKAPAKVDTLTLRLHRMTAIDDLAFSALIVVLRRHAARFRRMVLEGLPYWAGRRLKQTQAAELLGEGWTSDLGPGSASFRRDPEPRRRGRER